MINPTRAERSSITTRHNGLKKTSVVPKAQIFSIILTLGLMIGAAVLMAHSGGLPSGVHEVAIGGTVVFGLSVVTQGIFMLYLGVTRHKQHQKHEQLCPHLYKGNKASDGRQ